TMSASMICPANAACCPTRSAMPAASDQWIAVKARTPDGIPREDHSLLVRFVTIAFLPSYAAFSFDGERSTKLTIAVGMDDHVLKLCRMTSPTSREPLMFWLTFGFICHDIGPSGHRICTIVLVEEMPR